MRKSQLKEVEVLSIEVTENTLIKRAEALLVIPTIDAEDKEELQTLVDSYRTAEANEAVEELAKLEDEILDLLYYLEKAEA